MRAQGLRHGRLDGGGLGAARAAVSGLLTDQCGYHEATSGRMHRLEHRLERAGLACFVLTVVVALGYLAAKLPDLTGGGEGHGESLADSFGIIVAALTAGLPALATATYGIRVIGDFAGISRRSERTRRGLAALGKRIEGEAAQPAPAEGARAHRGRRDAGRRRRLAAVGGEPRAGDPWLTDRACDGDRTCGAGRPRLTSRAIFVSSLPRSRLVTTHHLLLLPGDGIGPEVMAEVRRVIAWFNAAGGDSFDHEEDLVGGSAYDAHGAAISEEAMAKAINADAVIFGAVGGPKWDGVPYEVRPEAGLLRLRKDLKLFANLRPAIVYPALADASSLKRELVEGLDILIVRELTGGVYFGEPKEIRELGNGQKRAIDTQVYDTYEIERIARVAFDLARTRGNKVTSMEKRNVMKSGVLWNEVVTATHKAGYSDVALDHMLADAGGMQLVRAPKQFDVIVTDNLFGDILSDVAAMLTGSLGMLPSASLGAPDAATGKRRALYEPVHGSAPDIAGKGLANPIAMLASFAMALRYSFAMTEAADRLEAAISAVLDRGLRTADIWTPGTEKVGTEAMGKAVVDELEKAA